MEREENLIAAFSFFDKDGSGYITIDELQQACRDFGLGDVQLDDTVTEIDQDNVSFSGFHNSFEHIKPLFPLKFLHSSKKVTLFKKNMIGFNFSLRIKFICVLFINFE